MPPSSWQSGLLYSRGRKSQRNLRITLYFCNNEDQYLTKISCVHVWVTDEIEREKVSVCVETLYTIWTVLRGESSHIYFPCSLLFLFTFLVISVFSFPCYVYVLVCVLNIRRELHLLFCLSTAIKLNIDMEESSKLFILLLHGHDFISVLWLVYWQGCILDCITEKYWMCLQKP
jgi:hypothetical protein